MYQIGILGPGAVGTLLGVALSAAGAPVVLVGRQPQSTSSSNLRAELVDGRSLVPGRDLRQTGDVDTLRSVDICLVAVKSKDTSEAGRTLGKVVSERAIIVSFQNGLRNVERLREHVRTNVVPGVVGFNMHRDSAGQVYQDTKGRLFAGRSSQADPHMSHLQRCFRQSGIRLETRRDIGDVMAGKLLMNLSNGVCAATGLGITELIRDRDARWCFARCIHEGLGVLRAQGYAPAAVRLLPPSMVANVLDFPDFLVGTVARWLLSTRKEARLSTLQDLDRGRRTEIDDIQGEIVSAADRHGLSAPANRVVLEVVHAHERDVQEGLRPKFLTAAELRSRIADGFAARSDG